MKIWKANCENRDHEWLVIIPKHEQWIVSVPLKIQNQIKALIIPAPNFHVRLGLLGLCWCHINKREMDVFSSKNDRAALYSKIHGDAAAMALVKGAYNSLVVRMDYDWGIMNTFLLHCIYHQLYNESFELSYVLALILLAWDEMPCIPETVNNNPDFPVSGGIYKDFKWKSWPMRLECADHAWGWENIFPPVEISNEQFG